MDHSTASDNKSYHHNPGAASKPSTNATETVGHTTVVDCDNCGPTGSAGDMAYPPFFGAYLTLVSMVILGLSAPLYSFFKEEADDYVPVLSHIYLYSLIVSAFGVFAGILISLRIYRFTHILVILFLFPFLYIAGYGWAMHYYDRIGKNMPHDSVSLAMNIFLGIGGFGGLINFFCALRRYCHTRSASSKTRSGSNTTEKGNFV